jgi:uridine kinase
MMALKPINESIRDRMIHQSVKSQRIEEDIARKVDQIVVAVHKNLADLVRRSEPKFEIDIARMKKKSAIMIQSGYSAISNIVEIELAKLTEVEVLEIQNIIDSEMSLRFDADA